MLIPTFHSLYSKISHIFWRKDRELELEFDFYCHFYNMTWLKFQLSRIRIYYFRWFQLDIETQDESRVLSVSLRLQGMIVEEKHALLLPWLLQQMITDHFSPCCTTLLCDSFNPRVVLLNILFTANFMGHWDLLWLRPSWDRFPCASTHMHAQPTWAHFHHQPVYNDLFHCGEPVLNTHRSKPPYR